MLDRGFLSNVGVYVYGAAASPHDHEAWGGNAYNLAAVGASWIVAESLAGRRRKAQKQKNGVA
jgi:hypothetical protein